MILRNSWLVAIVMCAVVAGLAGWMWSIEPDRAVAWCLTAGFLPAALIASMTLRRAGFCVGPRIADAITGAGFILAVSLCARLGTALGMIDGSESERITGALLGSVLVIIGNGLPKAIAARSCSRCDDGNTQRLHRFAGWTFVLAGLAYVAVWLFAPVEVASTASITFCATAGILVLTRSGWSFLQSRTGAPERSQ